MSSHVRTAHDTKWKEYQKEHPVVELPEDEETPKDETDEGDEASEGISGINDRLERVEAVINRFMSGVSPSGEPSGITDFPGEEIEVIGEKINYKVALDPEIFSTYNKFKGICIKRGTNWDKDFSDFLMMSVRTAMNYYGIYDMVVEMKGNKMLFEMPMGVR